MSKKMLINASHPEEHRAVIVDDGALTELEIEVVGREQTRGNIYKAVVVRVETGLQAAFVDYGADRLGFLQMGEIHPSCYRQGENGESKGRPRINDVLHRGQELLVQVVKEERGTKGAALTTFLSLPGRYMVLMPESDTKGVSRKIEEESQRKKLKSSMASMDLPSNMGYIVRTAGIGQTKEELKRDFDYLLRVYENILALAKRSKAPILVYKESNLVIRMIRDYFNPDIDEVLVDDPRVLQEAKDFFQQVMPEYAKLVKLHQEKRPIFSRYQIEEQIETINKNKVPLPSGGSIVIDSTEALVAIDVNSGKMASEQGVEATAYKTNMEAAAEVGRQLRLRDLGGLIVIDFIDMRDRKHIRDVEKCVKDALKNDKARVTVGHISSQFGLLEMSRQRIKTTLAEGSFLSCPHCEGSGRIKSTEAQAVAFLRKVQSGIAKGQVGSVEGDVPLDVATYLLNTRREELLLMERQHRLTLIIRGRSDLRAGQFELNFLKREKEEQAPEYVDAASVTPPTLEEVFVAEPEVPQETPEETPPAETAEESGKKKRKRRRRKKKSGEISSTTEDQSEETDAGEMDEQEAEEPVESALDAPVSAPQDEETTPAAAAEISVEETKPTKKPRRRRRKKPGVNAEGTATPVPPTPENPEDAVPPETAVVTATASQDDAVPTAAPQSETTTAASTEPAVATGADGKKKPARRRRKKPATAAAQTVPGDNHLPTVAIEALPVEQPAPAPTTPDATAPSASEGKPTTSAAESPTAGTAAAIPAEPKAKPTPKRRAPAKKPAVKGEAPAVEVTGAAAPAAAAEKPKPARKPRASKAKTAEPKAEGEQTPTKRRAPRKKAPSATTEEE